MFGTTVTFSVSLALNCPSEAVSFSTYSPAVVNVAVLIAFVASFRAAKRVERVLVTARDVRVTHETPTSSRVVWESPTAFTRVAVEKDEERTVGVNLMLSGREIPVAIALSPRERGEFAEALQNAIWEARRERG